MARLQSLIQSRLPEKVRGTVSFHVSVFSYSFFSSLFRLFLSALAFIWFFPSFAFRYALSFFFVACFLPYLVFILLFFPR